MKGFILQGLGPLTQALLFSSLLHILLITQVGLLFEQGASTSSTPQPRKHVDGKLYVSWKPGIPEALPITQEATATSRDLIDEPYSPDKDGERASEPVSRPGVIPLTTSFVSDYLPVGELDVRPGIRNQVSPAYPNVLMAGQTEKTTLIVLINEAGIVDETIVSKGASNRLFDESAQDAFAAALYTPGIKNGKAVKSRIVIEVRFDRNAHGNP